MHLGAEGGVGARQTTAPTGSDVLVDSTAAVAQSVDSSKHARLTIAFDSPEFDTRLPEASTKETKNAKAKQKRVLFQSDKPEIYDF
jgi:hypothetical protein